MTNFEIAKADADKVDELIIETLQNGDSFALKLVLVQERHIHLTKL